MHDTNLLQLFTDDIGHAKRLLELMDEEFQVLGERDLVRLEKLLADKQPLLAQLDQHGRQRSQLLASLQLSADRAGLEQLAARSPLGRDLLDRSEELGQLLDRCQSINERNGRLIRANRASVGNMLGILRGGDTPGLYDARGATARIGQQRPLSQA
ncbi:flagella synthesis protein FlgN [Pseudomonas sp. TCU-HL1]|uniref:flagella synthesis protein FlgN n=1 Tax=Pseudomonas sp. TCU-HL1 TaxID=1856685 RepID=UPI00083D5224|nr:flagellar protein FlgN [Pseudomonas sp. TCU-HL1]AOE86563.1 flagellar biosynthesis protein FlgN [Pseudomonas sp. TCU-HL1]